jgi:hypothetical protein
MGERVMQTIYVPSPKEANQYALRHATTVDSLMTGMIEDRVVFYQFIDYLCNEENEFHQFAELLRTFIVNDKEYLDHALNLRDFTRSLLIHFINDEAHKLV